MKQATRNRFLALIVGLSTGWSCSALAASDDIVFVMGKSSETPIAQAQLFETVELDIVKVCKTVDGVLKGAQLALPADVMEFLYYETPYSGEGLDCDKAKTQTGKYVIAFASCSMLMTDGTYIMRWTVPPDAPEAQMVIVDAQTKEFVEGSMLESELGAVQKVAKGREISQEVKPGGGSKTYEILVEIGTPDNFTSEMRKFTGQEYTYDYEGDISMPGMADVGISLGNMQSTGTAYVSPEVPGSDVVATFYRNFTDHVTPATESGTLLTAMIEQMSDLAKEGMPLETSQTVTIGIAGMAEGMTFGHMGTGNTSTSEIAGVAVWEGGASQIQACGSMAVPEGFTASNLDQMMSGGAGLSPEEAAEMNEALSEAQAALDNMTPEQKQMMESMGLGDMMNQVMGGSAPSGQQGAGAAALGASGAGAAAAAKSGSNMPESSALQSDNLTVSVQKHLDALGYDVGNTDGELSMETSIAISTFQAEKGMEVTGEVSPQLLGVLAAEVDSRR